MGAINNKEKCYMKILDFPKSIIKHLKVRNLRSKGPNIGRHVLVFESDDWGSIRMPSLEARNRLMSQGVVLQSPANYDRLDSLANEDDLTALIETLDSVRDKNGHPAVMTLDTVVCNPDFDKIKASGYNQYYYEPFTETLNKYPHHENSFALWKEGIYQGVFRPQFHGREHLNVQMWMNCLQQGEPSAKAAFDEGVFSMKCMIDGKPQRVLEAYNAYKKEDFPFMQYSVKEGLDLFEKIFGYRSESMIAPCYTWDVPIEDAAKASGVLYLQGNVYNSHSAYVSQSQPHQSPRILGTRNHNNQIQLVRNCSFEPSQKPNYNADRCLHDIERQFKMKHPAVVSCHRLNFIGDLVPQNRDKNLSEFKHLLQTVVRCWPDVEFMSSDQLGKLLSTYE